MRQLAVEPTASAKTVGRGDYAQFLGTICHPSSLAHNGRAPHP